MSAISLVTLSQNLNIATIEQLHVYTGLLMNRIYPTNQVLETPQQTQYACQFNTFQIADGSTRVLIRTSLPIDPNFVSDKSKKLWMFTGELGNLTIPPAFLSN